MKLLFTFFAFVSLTYSISCYGQAMEENPQKEVLIKNTPQEQLYLHTNTTFLFPGEYLLYKVYVLNRESNSLSNISKIAYVELIGEQGQQVFRHKVELENGTGHADFFIPTTTPSGNYKLVSYTNWMRNVEGNFFDTDITIINPYQSQQVNLSSFQNDSIQEGKNNLNYFRNKEEESDIIHLKLNKDTYGNRQQVLLKVENPGHVRGDFSVSVRKVFEVKPEKRKTAQSYLETEKLLGSKTGNSFYLPELRGQLVTGKISAKVDNINPAGQKIALSIPEENSFPLIGRTNKMGEFFFNLDKESHGKQATIEVVGENKGKFNIQVFKNPGIGLSDLDFNHFQLSPDMEKIILQRSIYNQIENAFFRVKPDTLQIAELEKPYYQNKMIIYDLDEYTRFKTIPETFVEIVNSAWIRKDSNGNRVFQVRGLENSINMGRLPLIVIDGMLIQDHSDLVYMDANKVKSIGIIREKVYVGPEIYQGVIQVETIDQNFYEIYSKEFVDKIDLKQPEIEKRYFQQKYPADSSSSRIPDFRYQLLWKPDVDMSSLSEETIEFYTSDVNGNFEVILEGFTEEGKPISLRKFFSVE